MSMFSENSSQLVLQLSAECRDLLDCIFVVDERKRITIPEIKAHPWWRLLDMLSSRIT